MNSLGDNSDVGAEFNLSQIVPLVIQDKAVDWLIKSIEEDMRGVKDAVNAGYSITEITSVLHAHYRSKILRASLIALYTDDQQRDK